MEPVIAPKGPGEANGYVLSLVYRAAENRSDLVVLDCASPEAAIAEIATPLFGVKRGRRTFTRPAAELHRP